MITNQLSNEFMIINVWSEVAQAWREEGLSKQSVTEKLLLAVGPRITRQVMVNI